MDDLMQRVAICQDFGWTYEQYDEQPMHFILAIKAKMKRDQKAQELAAKRTQRGN